MLLVFVLVHYNQIKEVHIKWSTLIGIWRRIIIAYGILKFNEKKNLKSKNLDWYHNFSYEKAW